MKNSNTPHRSFYRLPFAPFSGIEIARAALLFALIFLLPRLGLALDYFWANGSGNWSNYTAHWRIGSIGGAAATQVPTDGDGTEDCNDGCPLDPNKTAPGICGCGVADIDTDSDGTADCNDGCPNDADNDADGDGDASNSCMTFGNLTDYHMVFTKGNVDANWQGATKGYIGSVAVNGVLAAERTSGNVPYSDTLYTNDVTLGAWQDIVDSNSGQALSYLNETSRLTGLASDLENAFTEVNALTVTPTFESRSATSLNNLNTQDGLAQTIVVNVTSGFHVSSKINITGDANDFFILRWDSDVNFSNGYNGQVKFQSGGAIVPLGGLKASNFVHVAGDISASGGGSNPPAPYPQGPRTNNGTGTLITGGADFNGGGFFTGYWLTTGKPEIFPAGEQPYGKTASLSNAIFVGGWYSKTTKFSMTSGTSGVYVGCEIAQNMGAYPAGNNVLNPGPEVTGLNILVYPNPATNALNLNLHDYLEQPLSISIFNHLGQQVLHLKVDELHDPVLNIDLGKRQLPDGIYLLSVRTEEGQTVRQFVINQ